MGGLGDDWEVGETCEEEDEDEDEGGEENVMGGWTDGPGFE